MKSSVCERGSGFAVLGEIRLGFVPDFSRKQAKRAFERVCCVFKKKLFNSFKRLPVLKSMLQIWMHRLEPSSLKIKRSLFFWATFINTKKINRLYNFPTQSRQTRTGKVVAQSCTSTSPNAYALRALLRRPAMYR